MSELTRHTKRLTNAITAMDLADRLLEERGMQPDCSARHNLAIARSNVMDAIREAQSDEERPSEGK
jgi:hypothetical protein